MDNRANFNKLLRQARPESEGKCELCEEKKARPLHCCGQHLCDACMFQILEVCNCTKVKMWIKCPFCRNDDIDLDDDFAKCLMGKVCPSHCKIMKNFCTGRSMAVHHVPCDKGCYECAESKLMAYPA